MTANVMQARPTKAAATLCEFTSKTGLVRVLELLRTANGETRLQTLMLGRVQRMIPNVDGRQGILRIIVRDRKTRQPVSLGFGCNLTCEHTFGGTGCYINLAPLQLIVTASAISGNRIQLDDGGGPSGPLRGKVATYWEDGDIEKIETPAIYRYTDDDVDVWVGTDRYVSEPALVVKPIVRSFSLIERTVDIEMPIRPEFMPDNVGGFPIGGIVKVKRWETGTVNFVIARQPPASWAGSVLLTPGCNRLISKCRNVWNNEQNFGGVGIAIPDHNPLFEAPA